MCSFFGAPRQAYVQNSSLQGTAACWGSFWGWQSKGAAAAQQAGSPAQLAGASCCQGWFAQAAQGELRAVSKQLEASEEQSQARWQQLLGQLQAKEAQCSALSTASKQGAAQLQAAHAQVVARLAGCLCLLPCCSAGRASPLGTSLLLRGEAGAHRSSQQVHALRLDLQWAQVPGRLPVQVAQLQSCTAAPSSAGAEPGGPVQQDALSPEMSSLDNPVFGLPAETGRPTCSALRETGGG